ncbi:MAG: Nif3-like dinuclear metal center hexameric protein [Oscillospiraceae bacterium]|nr:Nif3-like dinuclear metal center hexameric protein [Oscillospiraceae bacterium]
MIKIYDIYKYLDEIAPFKLSEKWDNTGLLIGDKTETISKIGFCMDITDEVVDRCISENISLIISHHPVIFNPIKSIPKNSIVYRIIKNNISTIAIHTNLDKSPIGTSYALAKSIGLSKIKNIDITDSEKYFKISVYTPKSHLDQIFEAMSQEGAGKLFNYSHTSFSSEGICTFKPVKNTDTFIGESQKLQISNEIKIETIVKEKNLDNVISAMLKIHPYETPAYDVIENHAIEDGYGFCKVGYLKSEMTAIELGNIVKQSLNCDYIRVLPYCDKIKNVSVLAGAGSSYIKNILGKSEAFITSDIKHETMMYAMKNKITLIDAGHYQTEFIVFKYIKSMINKKFNSIKTTIFTEDKPIIKII